MIIWETHLDVSFSLFEIVRERERAIVQNSLVIIEKLSTTLLSGLINLRFRQASILVLKGLACILAPYIKSIYVCAKSSFQFAWSRFEQTLIHFFAAQYFLIICNDNSSSKSQCILPYFLFWCRMISINLSYNWMDSRQASNFDNMNKTQGGKNWKFSSV